MPGWAMRFDSDEQRRAYFARIHGFHASKQGPDDIKPGFHIGSKQAALERLHWHSGGAGPRFLKESTLVEYEGDFDKPFLKDGKSINEFNDVDESYEYFGGKQRLNVPKLVEEGYDHVPYVNAHEDPGSTSYMILDTTKLQEVKRRNVKQSDIDKAGLYFPDYKIVDGKIKGVK